MEFLKPIVEKLLAPSREPTIKVENGREYIYSDAARAYAPVEDASDHAPHATILLDCASLVSWCDRVMPAVETAPMPMGQIVISREGVTLAVAPFWRGNHVPRESAGKAFFAGYMPMERFDAVLTYEDMLAWTELLGDKLEGWATIEAALKTVAVASGSKLTAEQDGGVIKLAGESDKGVRLGTSIPKRLKARIPFGDPACEVDVQWALQVTVDKVMGTASFRLRHLISDGAFDGYAAWMRKELEALPEGWLVVCGP